MTFRFNDTVQHASGVRGIVVGVTTYSEMNAYGATANAVERRRYGVACPDGTVRMFRADELTLIARDE